MAYAVSCNEDFMYLNASVWMCVIPIVWFEPPMLLNCLSFYLATFLLLLPFFSQKIVDILYLYRLAFSCSFPWKLQGVWQMFCGIIFLYTIMIQNFAYRWTISLFPGRRGVALLGKVRWEHRIPWRDHPIRHGPGQCYITLLSYWIRKSCPYAVPQRRVRYSLLATVSVLDLTKRR